MILILVFIWMMMMLFVVKFVVVMLGMLVVIILAQENAWLWVCWKWPNEQGGGDVVFMMEYVVLDVVYVVVCVGFDGLDHGEVWEIFGACGRLEWWWCGDDLGCVKWYGCCGCCC